ncbi:hypothetical protein JW964_08815 [candidate division KSB1 bacterium]|nr:hypothetical protein [candidate division KSB1 bacterium]
MKLPNQLSTSLKSMEDIELIQIRFREQTQYEADFLAEVQEELKRRKINVAESINQIQIRYNYSEPQMGTIDEARSKLTQPLDCWDVYYFTNILNETLLVQHIYFAWVAHVFTAEYYSYSFLANDLAEFDQILTKFLKLEEWESEVTVKIIDWEELAQLDSYGMTENLIQALVAAKIPFSVKKPDLPHFNAIFGTYYERSKIVLLVHRPYHKQAKQIIEQIESQIEQLHKKLKIYEANNDYFRQIEIYFELEKWMSDDAILYFNKGSLFYEVGEFQAAAEALIQSLNIQLEKNQTIEIDEIKYLLGEISNKFPQNIEILHALAVLARVEEDNTLEMDYYQQILKLNSSDSIAHLNLGYLYYHQEDENEQAKYHFQKYLDLEPEAEDREAIEDLFASFITKK